jgi:hypothetical protein
MTLIEIKIEKVYGLFDSQDNLLSVHKTEQGAEENKKKYENRFRNIKYHVDYDILHQ